MAADMDSEEELADIEFDLQALDDDAKNSDFDAPVVKKPLKRQRESAAAATVAPGTHYAAKAIPSSIELLEDSTVLKTCLRRALTDKDLHSWDQAIDNMESSARDRILDQMVEGQWIGRASSAFRKRLARWIRPSDTAAWEANYSKQVGIHMRNLKEFLPEIYWGPLVPGDIVSLLPLKSVSRHSKMPEISYLAEESENTQFKRSAKKFNVITHGNLYFYRIPADAKQYITDDGRLFYPVVLWRASVQVVEPHGVRVVVAQEVHDPVTTPSSTFKTLMKTSKIPSLIPPWCVMQLNKSPGSLDSMWGVHASPDIPQDWFDSEGCRLISGNVASKTWGHLTDSDRKRGPFYSFNPVQAFLALHTVLQSHLTPNTIYRILHHMGLPRTVLDYLTVHVLPKFRDRKQDPELIVDETNPQLAYSSIAGYFGADYVHILDKFDPFWTEAEMLRCLPACLPEIREDLEAEMPMAPVSIDYDV